MYKMTVHITKEFETINECQNEYEEIRGELTHHDGLHINCQIVTKLTGYSPQSPQGHEVKP